MKQLLLFLSLALFLQTHTYGQCPNVDSDNDGVLDCIDPCPNVASSKIGNLSFESDFIGWTIPQNSGSFSISSDVSNSLHGDKSLYVTAPNAATFEGHAIYTEAFTLEEGVPYNFKIPVKRVGNVDGDAFRWALVDENGVYRHLNNYYSFTENWTYITFENFQVNFDFYTSNKFRLLLEFGLSTTDMVVDKIEFYETSRIVDPAYLDMDADGNPDCVPFSSANHPDYDALVALFYSMRGFNWLNKTNWLDTTKPISTWYGITEENGRVTGIKLNDNWVYPEFPPEIGNLTELKSLELYSDTASYTSYAPIPPEIGNLNKLEYLDLRFCIIQADLPKELGNLTNLNWLDLRSNNFTGAIPQEFTNLSSLSVLLLSGNQLSGPIPDFSGLPLLNYLWLDNNYFQFGDLEPNFDTTNTSVLNYLYSPQAHVGITASQYAVGVGNSTTLSPNVSGSQNNYTWSRINADGSQGNVIGNGETMDVTINSVDDYDWYYYFEATSNIVSNLALRSYNLKLENTPSSSPDYDALVALYNSTNGDNWNNQTYWLDDTKPLKWWGGIYEVENNRVVNLDLGINNLTGTIPPEIGDLSELTSLSFFANDITGEIPDEIWTLTKLKMLLLGNQASKQLQLPSGVPPEISNLQDLEWINLNYIPLTQPLQPELFNLPKLRNLRIVDCGLTGSIPKELATIDNVRASLNEFEGTIPQEFLDATGNSLLEISSNYFDFNDLEPLVQANNYSLLNYSPQRTKDIALNLEFAPGEDITLTIDDTRLNKEKNSKGVGDIYQWFKDGAAITGANASSYTITNAQETDSGVYHCEITNNLVPDLIIIRADIALLIDASLSIDKNLENSFSVYPNPTHGIINIKLNNTINASAELFDINGRKIRELHLPTTNTVLDIGNLNSGMYLLHLKTNNATVIKRIIKQ